MPTPASRARTGLGVVQKSSSAGKALGIVASHDHEHLAGVGHDLDGSTAARQTHGGLVPVTDDAGVEAAVAVDLRRTEEADVDVAALQHVPEQRCHGHHGFGAGDHDGVGDALGHRLGVRAADPGLVDQLDVGVGGAGGEVDGEGGQTHPGEDPGLAGQGPRSDGDDQFGGGEVFGGGHFRLP